MTKNRGRNCLLLAYKRSLSSIIGKQSDNEIRRCNIRHRREDLKTCQINETKLGLKGWVEHTNNETDDGATRIQCAEPEADRPGFPI